MINTTEKEYLICMIKEYILELYGAIYNKSMDIIKTEDGYILKMYITEDYLTPLCIYIQCDSKEKFLEKIKKELHLRGLNLTRYFVGQKIDLDERRIQTRIERLPNSESESSYF